MQFNSRKITPPSQKDHKSITSLDFKHFLWHTPVKDTQIKFTTAAERDYYNQLVQQRIGIDTSKFSILNFHKTFFILDQQSHK